MPFQFSLFKMIRNIITNCKSLITDLENAILSNFLRNSFSPGLCMLPVCELDHKSKEGRSLLDILQDAYLFAVPKSRRTVEKRRNRKFGWPEYTWKPIVPKTNILICTQCGHDYLAGYLCGNCYENVKKETELMQKAIEENLKLEPIEKEVIVLYEDELGGKNQEFWEGKRIVEMKKKRPSWFSQNLLQKSTVKDTETKDDKPSKEELA